MWERLFSWVHPIVREPNGKERSIPFLVRLFQAHRIPALQAFHPKMARDFLRARCVKAGSDR